MIKILGSIKNSEEASIIDKHQFDIIDIKNIEDGALGYVGDKQLKTIVNEIGQRVLSVTAGNQVHPNTDKIIRRTKLLNSLGIKYIKIGVFNTKHIENHKLFLEKTSMLNIKKVAVLFASELLDINQITNFAELNYDGLMIDTIDKSNKCTLSILNNKLISKFVNECHNSDKFCGLSGSMSYKDIEYAMSFRPDFIGFRGALCSSSNRKYLDSIKCESIINKIKITNQKMYQVAV